MIELGALQFVMNLFAAGFLTGIWLDLMFWIYRAI